MTAHFKRVEKWLLVIEGLLAIDAPPALAELDAYCPECGEWITATDGYCVWHDEPVEVDAAAPWGVMPCPPKTTPSDA